MRQHVASLSGGQRQTVAIAKAVLWNSQLVILDEPTAALGVAQTAQVLELVRRLADNGLAVVLISHNMNDVFAVSDRIAALYLGRMVAQVKTDRRHPRPGGRADHRRPQRRRCGLADGRTHRNVERRHDRAQPSTSRRAAVRPPTCHGTPAGPLSSHVRDYLGRVRGGDIGALPAVLGLIVLCTVFADRCGRPSSPPATSPTCFTQGAAVMVIAMGLVFVLLLGEIDLSRRLRQRRLRRGAGLAAHRTACPGTSAVLAAIATGVVIGLVLGFLVAKVGIPSFVVTLAAFLAFQGVGAAAHQGGTNISGPRRGDPGHRQPEHAAGARLGAGGRRASPATPPCSCSASATGAAAGLTADAVAGGRRSGSASLAVVAGVAVYVLNLERSRNPLSARSRACRSWCRSSSCCWSLWTFVLNRTAYGRHIYAVGGNREAARRAGINVDRIRISAFVICSTMAAVGGIIAASRASSVDANTGGSNVLLYAVGAAVIGGTSLFGGKGRVLDAVLGGAVVAVINNGMGLMGYSSGVKYVVTGSVLLLAAGVDALSRRGRPPPATR